MTILITGATGYIGSHVSLELAKRNYEIILLDNLSNSKKDVVDRLEAMIGKKLKFYHIDLCDKDKVKVVFEENIIHGVINLAGFKSVSESIANPLKYYENNLGELINLCSAMDEYNVKNLVYSSSATVYGENNISPLTEDMPLSTLNPYGNTKLFSEQILRELYNSDNSWSISILRYFNPVGADESGMIGEDPRNEPTNLMPIITKVAAGKIDMLNIFGDDYGTPDGTCIRDFIHITDLAEGHVRSIEKNTGQPGLNIYNIGTGSGYSVLEMVNTFQEVNDIKVNYRFAPKRPGDIGVCYANPKKALMELGWFAKKDLAQMCKDAWRWELNNKG